jgi:hypothetical protein
MLENYQKNRSSEQINSDVACVKGANCPCSLSVSEDFLKFTLSCKAKIQSQYHFHFETMDFETFDIMRPGGGWSFEILMVSCVGQF